MGRLKRALQAAPLAAIVAFVTEWTNLLRVPALVHPDWGESAGAVARVLSVAVILVLFLVLERHRRPALRRWALWFLGGWIAFMIACLAFGPILHAIAVPEAKELVISLWHGVFEAANMLAVASALAIGLWAAAPP